MITLRKSQERGHANHGWLDSYHTFSFAGYQDRNHMRFRSLRVMNEDWIAPGQGFGRHPHQDMEIITYVLDGKLEHHDSMGNGSVLHPGDFQRMTAGTGVEHSEFNPSADETLHLYQIWLYPAERGLVPSYEERSFRPREKYNRLRLVASHDGRDESLTIHQDADIYLSDLAEGASVSHKLHPGRHAWVQVMRGNVKVSNASGRSSELTAGDAAAVSEETAVELTAASPAEVMLFDLK